MLLKLFLAPVVLTITGLINLIPVLQIPAERVVGLVNMLVTSLNFFSADCWLLAMGTIVFWMTVHLIIGVLHFIAGLLPLLNIRIGG